jgi:hypothetical protein
MTDQDDTQQKREKWSTRPVSKDGSRATSPFTLPAGQWAMFYCSATSPSQYVMKVYIFLGDEPQYNFQVLAAPNTLIGEYQNSQKFPVEYELSAALYPSNDLSALPDWATSFDEVSEGNGFQYSFPTGETDDTGNPVVQVVTMQMQAHP